MSEGSRLRSEVDDLERKTRRLLREVEAGDQTDPAQIADALRKLLRNEIDNIERIARNMNDY